MRKILLVAAGLLAVSVAAAHADPLTDWVLAQFGVPPTQGDPGGAQPDGDGSGVGTTNAF